MRKKYSALKPVLTGLSVLAMCLPALKAQTNQTFNFTGSVQTWVVPSCVSTITFDVRGAEGGDVSATTVGWGAGTASVSGGEGGRVVMVMTVTPGDVYNIYVGGKGSMTLAGWNGGGAPGACSGTEVYGAGGGGASDIRKNGTAFTDRFVVAGGGGGASGSGNNSYQSTNNTGAGGGLNGGNATNTQIAWGFTCIDGQGGTQTAGGAGGNNTCYCNGNLTAPSGSLGLGGNVICAPSGLSTCACGGTGCTSGGGGGGGYYGGGAGIAIAAGGGGSSYSSPSASSVTHTQGFQTGDGQIILSYNFNGAITGASATPSIICSGNSAVLNSGGSMVSYTWSTGANTSSITVSPTVNTTYTIQATNSLGCISTATIVLPVNAAIPSLTLAPNSASVVCAGKTSTLTASGALSYTWTGGVTNATSFTPAATGGYTVTGGNACGTSSVATSITVNPLPTIGGAANNPTVCNGTSVILNGTGSAGNYTWTGGVLNNTTFTPSATQQYTVTGSSALGCTNTAVVGVTVFVTPTVPPVTSATAVCLGKSATLTAVGATSGYTWSTSPPANTSSIVVTPNTTTTYTLERASGSCTSTALITVSVMSLPVFNVATPNPATVCAGTASSLIAIGAITYTWYPGNFSGGAVTVYPNSSTVYTVVAANAQCTAAANTTVTTKPNPTLTIVPASSVICAGAVTTLTVSGAATYTWASPVSAPQQSQTTVTVNPIIPTLYNVTGTGTNNCTSGQSQVLLVNAAPNLTVSVANPGGFICAGDVGTLVAQGVNPTTYSWNTGSAAPSITVNPASTTVYTVTGTNTVTTCQSVKTVTLAVFISTFVVASPTAICKGDVATITASGAASSYSWSFSPTLTASSATVSPQVNTNYVITGITGNCQTTQTVSMIVNPVPNITGSPAKSTICRFEPGVLTATGGGAGATYSWSTGQTAPSITVTPIITTTYVVTGTNASGCSKSVNVVQFISTCIGINEVSGNLAEWMSLYPNPNNGEFTIKAQAALNVTVVNELGQVVKSFKISEAENTVNMSNLSNGIYMIVVEKDGNTGTMKMVVNR